LFRHIRPVSFENDAERFNRVRLHLCFAFREGSLSERGPFSTCWIQSNQHDDSDPTTIEEVSAIATSRLGDKGGFANIMMRALQSRKKLSSCQICGKRGKSCRASSLMALTAMVDGFFIKSELSAVVNQAANVTLR
jgi:hypothetical protein